MVSNCDCTTHLQVLSVCGSDCDCLAYIGKSSLSRECIFMHSNIYILIAKLVMTSMPEITSSCRTCVFDMYLNIVCLSACVRKLFVTHLLAVSSACISTSNKMHTLDIDKCETNVFLTLVCFHFHFAYKWLWKWERNVSFVVDNNQHKSTLKGFFVCLLLVLFL